MNVNIEITLYEGANFIPNENQQVSLKASLESLTRTTDPVPLINSCPKFECLVAWEAGVKDFRRCRMNRIPIRIECFISEQDDNQRFLGRIIIPIPPMTDEDDEVEPKQYKLLGGPSDEQEAPSILLKARSIKTFDEQEEEEEEDGEIGNYEESNGEVCDNSEMSNASEVESLSGASSDLGMNEHEEMLEEEDELEDMPEEENAEEMTEEQVESQVREEGEVFDEDGSEREYEQVLDEATEITDDSELSEDDMSDEMCEESDDNAMYEEHLEGECAGAENRENGADKEENTDKPEASDPEAWQEVDDEDEEDVDLYEDMDDLDPEEGNESDEEFPLQGHTNGAQLQEENPMEYSPEAASRPICDLISPMPEGIVNNTKTDENTKELQTRRLGKEELQKQKREFTQNITPNTPSVKRPLECSPEPNVSGEHIITKQFKKRKLTDTNVYIDAETVENKELPEATAVANTLAISIDKTPVRSAVKVSPTSFEKPKILAELNEDGGFFQIGPKDPRNEQVYNFSVTIMYASNLDKAISEAVPNQEYTISYELFGCPIYTEPFYNLMQPELSAEKGTASIHSSPNFLFQYFQQNPFLSVNLVSGDVKLLECLVNISKFTSIHRKESIEIKGNYDVRTDALSSDLTSPTIGVCVQLECLKKPKASPSFNHSHFSQTFDESDNSSDSDSDFGSSITQHKKFKYSRDRRKMRKILKYERSDMLYEASLQIEEWKERQKKQFMKQWSMREKALHKHLASEWEETCTTFHSALEKRMAECDKLQEKLKLSIDQLGTREAAVSERESKVEQREMELEREKIQKHQMNGDHSPYNSVCNDETRISELKSRVSELQNTINRNEKKLQEQSEEIISLRRKLLVKDDIRILKKDEAKLMEDLESALEQKQYYKSKWLSSLQDLYKIHTTGSSGALQKETVTVNNVQEEGTARTSRLKELLNAKKGLIAQNVATDHPGMDSLNQKIRNAIETFDY